MSFMCFELLIMSSLYLIKYDTDYNFEVERRRMIIIP